MSEIKSNEKNVPIASGNSNPHDDGIPAHADQPPRFQSAISPTTTIPHVADAGAVQIPPSSTAETKAVDIQQKSIQKPLKTQYNWILLSIIFLFLFVLVLLIIRPRNNKDLKNIYMPPQNAEENADLSNYSAFVAKNKALRGDEYSESILTDEPYVGQAPLTVRPEGPLISPEIDPQLAALTEAFKIRMQHIQGSQLISRGKTVNRFTRGDFRGFKVNAVENLGNGVAVSGEITVTTPQNGLLKTINLVLEDVQRTDFSRINSELQNAGMEFTILPVVPNNKIVRGRLRTVRYWGKPIPGELLITGKSVGGITLAMPVAQIKSKLDPSYSMLKRKILVNDVYFDVFKITGRGEEPLLYIYEKDGQVWGISIVSEIFMTERGIGIGSSLDLIRLNYPSIMLANSEKKPPFIRIAGVDGIFIVQAEGERKVISILIGQSPEFE